MRKKIFFAALLSIVLTSCSSTYYQVYKTASSEKISLKDNLLVYEDENCKVSYNFWEDEGNIGFVFFNKTDKNIYLNLEESFFIHNGVANNYYKNRVFTNLRSAGVTVSKGAKTTKSVFELNTVGIITSSGNSVSFNEEKIVCIPALTQKAITEYTINQSPFRDCDFLRFPTKRQIKSMKFNKSDSPLVFSNRIAYTIGQTDSKTIKFENEFYVTEISNYPEREITNKKFEKFCGETNRIKTKFFKKVSADQFYIKYNRGQDDMKY